MDFHIGLQQVSVTELNCFSRLTIPLSVNANALSPCTKYIFVPMCLYLDVFYQDNYNSF